MVEHLNTISIIVAMISSSGVTTVLNMIYNRRKQSAESAKVEQSIIGDKIDHATRVVAIATNLLEDVEKERAKLRIEKQNLEDINTHLLREISELKTIINDLKSKWKISDEY